MAVVGRQSMISLLMAALALAPFMASHDHVARADPASPTTFYHATFDDGTDWSLEPGIIVSDNIRRNGSALMFADDRGTTTPSDNRRPSVCPDHCFATATSPWIELPSHVPMFVYWWADATDGGVYPAVERQAPNDPSMQGSGLWFGDMDVPGWHRVNISDLAGETVRFHVHFWVSSLEGPYGGPSLDDLWVTDLDVPVEQNHIVFAEGAVTEVVVDVPAEGAEGRIVLLTTVATRNGTATVSAHVAPDGAIDGRLWGTDEWGNQSITVSVSEHPIYHDERHSSCSGYSCTTGIGTSLRLDELSPGRHRLLLADSNESTETLVVVETTTGLPGVGVTTGGRTAGHAPAHRYSHLGPSIYWNGQPYYAFHIEHEIETHGRSLAGFRELGPITTAARETSGGREIEHHVAFSEVDTVWRHELHQLMLGPQGTYMAAFERPPEPALQSLQPPSSDGLPAADPPHP